MCWEKYERRIAEQEREAERRPIELDEEQEVEQETVEERDGELVRV